MHDLRYAIRVLRRSPGFAAIAVLSLALGIGANTAIFSVSWVLFSQPLAVQDPDHLGTPIAPLQARLSAAFAGWMKASSVPSYQAATNVEVHLLPGGRGVDELSRRAGSRCVF